MGLTLQQVEKLLKGNFKSSQLSFSMLLTRMKGLYNNDQSQTTLQTCAKEINAFFTRYSSIMKNEYEAISKL